MHAWWQQCSCYRCTMHSSIRHSLCCAAAHLTGNLPSLWYLNHGVCVSTGKKLSRNLIYPARQQEGWTRGLADVSDKAILYVRQYQCVPLSPCHKISTEAMHLTCAPAKPSQHQAPQKSVVMMQRSALLPPPCMLLWLFDDQVGAFSRKVDTSAPKHQAWMTGLEEAIAEAWQP